MASQPGKKLPRFPTSSDCLSDVEPDTRELVRAQNKKKKKSGGFQSMGVDVYFHMSLVVFLTFPLS